MTEQIVINKGLEGVIAADTILSIDLEGEQAILDSQAERIGSWNQVLG